MKQAYARGLKSGCAVPLLCHDKIVGSMMLASLRESAFTEDDANLLTQIGSQVAIAVDNALNYERLRCAECEVVRERDRTKLLLEVNNAVVSHLDLRELVKSISASLSRIIPHDGAFFTLLESAGRDCGYRHWTRSALQQASFAEGVSISPEGTPEGEALSSEHAVLVGPQIDLQRFHSPWVRNAAEKGIQSGCAVPLIAHGRPLGALSVVSQKEAAFTSEHAMLLEQCSSQIAIALENASQFRECAERRAGSPMERDRSRLLLEVNNAVTSQLDLSSLLKSTSRSLRSIMPYDSAYLGLSNADGSLMQVQGLDLGELSKDPSFQERNLIPLDGTPEQQAVLSGKAVRIRSVADMAAYTSPWVQHAVKQGVQSGCVVPLIARDCTLGFLGLVSMKEEAFSEADANLLEQCSGQVAIAVENAINFEKTRQAEREVRHERDRSRYCSTLTMRWFLTWTCATW